MPTAKSATSPTEQVGLTGDCGPIFYGMVPFSLFALLMARAPDEWSSIPGVFCGAEWKIATSGFPATAAVAPYLSRSTVSSVSPYQAQGDLRMASSSCARCYSLTSTVACEAGTLVGQLDPLVTKRSLGRRDGTVCWLWCEGR
jgi:hypothetical protein